MPEIPEIPEFPHNPELSRHPETPEIPEIPEIPIRKGRPSGLETRFSTLSGRFLSQFPSFSRSHCASALPRNAKGRTLILTGMRGTSERFCILRKGRQSIKIGEKLLRKRCTNAARAKNSLFSLPEAPRRRFWSPRSAPGRSRPLFLTIGAAPGDSPGAPGMLPGRSRDDPGAC